MGALKWGLKATLQFAHNLLQLSTFWAFLGPVSKGNFRRKMTTIVGNRGQLWTSTLSPLFAEVGCLDCIHDGDVPLTGLDGDTGFVDCGRIVDVNCLSDVVVGIVYLDRPL